MYENTSYDDRKRCKGCTVLNRLRERNASPDRISVCWQSGDRQSGVLEVIVMKPWHYPPLSNRSSGEVRNERRREILYGESRPISAKSPLQMSGVNLKHIFWMLQFLPLVLLVASVACLLVASVASLCKMSVACICCASCSRLAVMIA